MIGHPAYPVDPWCLRENWLDLGVLAQSESLFALSNGHLGWRGNLDEGEPHGMPGTYLNGVFEYREGDADQYIVNVTNGKIVRLLVDDEPFDPRYGRLHGHHRVLDPRTGVLERVVEWTAPSGRTVRIRSWRLVSLTQRAIGALAYEVEPVDGEARIVVQSELLANEQLPGGEGTHPVLESEECAAEGTELRLVHRTRNSGLRVAVAAEHVVSGPASTTIAAECAPDLARLTVTTHLKAGEVLRLEKLVAHGWSAKRTLAALRDQVEAALTGAASTGWEGLVREQEAYLDGFWPRADVELDGDPELQQAVRFALFSVLQAAARAEERAIPAKGLTGPGFDGHCMWDTEAFVLPVLTYTAPPPVAQALRWRHNTLSAARHRARQLDLEGAAFPARTINGEECSHYWPTGLAALHLNADIADAVTRYTHATEDLLFERDAGLELLVHTARLWTSLGHHDQLGIFHLDGVTGPDEYSAVADDNVYTNLMAQQNLRAAADAAERHADLALALGVTDEETATWRDAARHVALPYDELLGVHQQSAGFTRHRRWDFDHTPADHYPLSRHYPDFQLYRHQVLQQADLVRAMHLRSEAFSADEKARNFAYYDALTVRDSPLSACSQAVLAAEVGHLELAYAYLSESSLIGLEEHMADGLRLAVLAGTWTALVAGFGGMRHHGDTLAFAPRLPAELARMAFTMQFQRRTLRVEFNAEEALYTLLDGADLDLWHHGTQLTATRDTPVRRPIPPRPEPTPVEQPLHRSPVRRHQAEPHPTEE